MKQDNIFTSQSFLIEAIKEQLKITAPTDGMTDDEIRRVCKWVGEHAPDTEFVDGKRVIRRMGIEAMIFIALTEFPEFYQRYELSPID